MSAARSTSGCTDPESVVDAIRRLVDEELHLLGHELEDALGPHEAGRLVELTGILDTVEDLLTGHRATRRQRPHG